jgi:purine-binding chemotaxis protein CheW
VTRPDATAGAELVVFRLEQQRYALPVDRVERVLPMVALAAFPRAPGVVSGVFDLEGEIIPVVSLRRRFRLPDRPPRPDERLIVSTTRRRRVALAIDAVEPVVSVAADEMIAAGSIVPGLEFVRGIVRLPNLGLVFVHDLDSCLSLDEERQLAAALEERGG